MNVRVQINIEAAQNMLCSVDHASGAWILYLALG